MSETTPAPVTIHVVCTGAFISKDKKLLHQFQLLKDDGTLDPEILVWGKLSGFPGTVYTVETPSFEKFKETGTITPSTLRWERKWDVEADVQKWQLIAKEASVQLEADRRKGKEKELFDQLKKDLRPARLLYAKTNPQGKAAIMAVLIRILQQDPRFEEEDD